MPRLNLASLVRVLAASSKRLVACARRRRSSRNLVPSYRQAVASLPERTRAVFILHRIEHLSYDEIARRLGMTSSGVERHLAQALAHIARALDDGQPD